MADATVNPYFIPFFVCFYSGTHSTVIDWFMTIVYALNEMVYLAWIETFKHGSNVDMLYYMRYTEL